MVGARAALQQIIVLAAVTTLGGSAAAEPEVIPVAVVAAPAASGFAESLLERAIGLITGYANASLGLRAMTPSVPLKQLRVLAQCPTDGCTTARRLASTLHVRSLLLVKLEQVGRNFSLSVLVFDGQSGRVTGQASRELVNSDEIYSGSRDLVHLAVTHQLREPKGLVRVDAPDGAVIEVDGQAIGTAPLTVPVRLTPGAHKVRATLINAVPAEQDVNVLTGSEVAVKLAPAPVEPSMAPPPLTPIPLAAPRIPLPLPSADDTAVDEPRPIHHQSSDIALRAWSTPLAKVGWGLSAGAVVSLITAIGLGVAAEGHESHLRTTDQTPTAVAREVYTARGEAISTNVLLGVSAALAIAGPCLLVEW